MIKSQYIYNFYAKLAIGLRKSAKLYIVDGKIYYLKEGVVIWHSLKSKAVHVKLVFDVVIYV